MPGKINVSGGKENLSIEIFAEGFVDPDGDPLIYDWDMGDGNGTYFGLQLTEVSHTYEKGGNYTVTLKLMDGRGGEAVVEIILNITAPPDDPLDPDGNESQDDDVLGPDDTPDKDESGSEEKGIKAVGAWILTSFIILLLAFVVIFVLLSKKRKNQNESQNRDNKNVSTQAEECSSHPVKDSAENPEVTTRLLDEDMVEDADDRSHGSQG